MNGISKYISSLRHLRPRQVYYLLRNRLLTPSDLRPSFFRQLQNSEITPTLTASNIKFRKELQLPIEVVDGQLQLLNRNVSFDPAVFRTETTDDPLFDYNLAYLDFIHQLPPASGHQLIDRLRSPEFYSAAAVAPYPTSLRLMNVCQYLWQFPSDNAPLLPVIDAHLNHLSRNLEHHLGANHLLENGFALVIGGAFAQRSMHLREGVQLLSSELAEQVLPDGGHYEGSPSYHLLLLGRLLELIEICQQIPDVASETVDRWRATAARMLSWATHMSFASGRFPLFNDCTEKTSPTVDQVLQLAARLSISTAEIGLNESGYRKLQRGPLELIVDAAPIRPDYNPGHSHADMLTFELESNGRAFVVDTGTSSYHDANIRKLERSTAAHNTVTIDDADQLELFGKFRIGKRSSVAITVDETNHVAATRTGFRTGQHHERHWTFGADGLTIRDLVSNGQAAAYFHFHPDVQVSSESDRVTTDRGVIQFQGHSSIQVFEYFYAPEFNKRIPAKRLRVDFENELVTTIAA